MPAMTHRQILEAMSGLMLGMFVAILSSTVVATSLPRIVSDLGGTQSGYTWVVTSTLLALTVSTPVWGKLADLFDRKLLVQTGLIIFVFGSVLAGLSTSMGWLIACRAIQGVGAGGSASRSPSPRSRCCRRRSTSRAAAARSASTTSAPR
jgi:MFS family permease